MTEDLQSRLRVDRLSRQRAQQVPRPCSRHNFRLLKGEAGSGVAEAKEEEEGDEGRVGRGQPGEEQEMGPGGCVSRGGTRLSYTLKMFPVAAEWGSAIRPELEVRAARIWGPG